MLSNSKLEKPILNYYKRLYKNNEQIGIEFEFIINKINGSIIDLNVIKSLSNFIIKDLGFGQIEEYDNENTPVIMRNPKTLDKINFETCYSIIELSFNPAIKIQEIEDKFISYYNAIQDFLLSKDHILIDLGSNPYSWVKNIPTLRTEYYSIVMPVIKKYQRKTGLYNFNNCFSAIASCQTHFSLSEEKTLKILNVFNKTEWVKGLLFANSCIWNNSYNLNLSLCARDYFWENSGLLSNNYVFPVADISFKNIKDYYLFKLQNMQTGFVIREEKYILIEKMSVFDYLKKDSLLGVYINKEGKKTSITIHPRIEDISYFRSYCYNTLTKYGTIENRSVCMQPFGSLFAPTAFSLGIIQNHEKISTLMSGIYEKNSTLRKKATLISFFDTDEKFADLSLIKFLHKFCEIVKEGLMQRGYGEEKYINCLFKRIESKENPAINLIEKLQKGQNIEDILIKRVEAFKT
jgi:gamma-glutamylcysteine synthetase